MNYITIVDRSIAINDLFKDRQCFSFVKTFFLLDSLGEIFITQLRNNIDVILGVVYIINSNDIMFILELFEKGNLVLEEFFMEFPFDKL